MPHVEFSWVALKPIRAEHPLGSGVVVEYMPGDLVPANDWGQAVEHLAANGKIAQIAINVLDPGEVAGVAAPPGPPPTGLSDPDRAYLALEGQPGPVEPDGAFPRHLGNGLYELGDGSKVRGKRAALAGQEALEAPLEAVPEPEPEPEPEAEVEAAVADEPMAEGDGGEPVAAEDEPELISATDWA